MQDMVLPALTLLAGGLGGSVFTYAIGRWHQRQRLALKVWLFPLSDSANEKLCFVRLVCERTSLFLAPITLVLCRTKEGKFQCWGSRPGLTWNISDCKIVISDMREGDFIEVLYPVSKANVPDKLDGKSIKAFLDYNGMVPSVHVDVIDNEACVLATTSA
jgi:hypothetical protein